ncbi:malectin domain-containing carbohydrate-binding protein [uncultured Desulfosarcina sp.]|uniref:malectin domain-containing carbohydrate-binding protein n=1 Tax=uncultured Desulfosarcina sp. TaxID=218289 RepID=UPI0029C8D880|nr:malectin domain-containing carbohydrate-binding protein [uncultured Desulfosarcina sp.]
MKKNAAFFIGMVILLSGINIHSAVADIRVNAGGGAYTDGSGNIWSADSGFNTGLTASTANPISGTTDDVLYQTERYDKAVSPELEYRFTVPNGDYLVRLYFTELFSGAGGVGLRVFDVLIENQLVIDNLDIFSEVGLYAALIKSIPVTVADGQLNILFQHIMDENPKISAIEVVSQDDTTPPTVPAGLSGSAADATQINLSWNPSTDTGGSGLAGYRIYRNGGLAGTSTTSAFTDTGLAPSTTYSYAVTAYDNALNESDPSSPVSVSTTATADTTPPTVPAGLSGSAADATQINLSWNPSTDTGGSGLAGYRIYRNGGLAGTSTTPAFTDTGLAPSTTYSYAVTAYDNALNESDPSSPVSVSTTATADTTPPTVPAGLSGSAADATQINLSWNPSTDTGGSGLAGYRIYRNGGLAGTSTTSAFTDTGLAPSTTYSYAVTAYDNALNESDPSSPVSVSTTATADTTPPTVPAGLSGSAADATQINLSWNPSTDTGGSGLAGYRIYRNGGLAGTSTTPAFTDTGLAPSTTYSYAVTAYDNALNESDPSSPVSVSTTATAGLPVIRVNAGGGAYTDGSGNIWSADSGFNTGLTASTANPISGTTNDVLYQTERYDKAVSPELEYRFTVPNGDYLVRLYFTELFSGAGGVGLRVFDVLIENQLVIDNLDIFSEVGLYAALIKSIPVTVADGQLNILFQHIMDENPKISAIEVVSQDDTTPPTVPAGLSGSAADATQINLSWNPSTDTGGSGLAGYRIYRNGGLAGTSTTPAFTDTGLAPSTTYSYAVTAYDNALNESDPSSPVSVSTTATAGLPVIRVNAGGGAYTDGSGNIWSADSGFNTGLTASTANPISGTTNDVLYQTERYDKAVSPELEYRFTVPNGDYLVRLYFTELFSGAGGVGLRVFDVLIENQLVIDNLDIFSEVGLYAALIKSIPVTVADGQLNILFQHIMDENPKISAIEVVSQDDTTPPTVPAGLSGSAADATQINLSWNPSTDTGGSGLAGYRIYRNGGLAGTSTTPAFTDTGLAPSTTYSYAVTAYDNALNESDPSSPVSVSTTATAGLPVIRVNAGGGAYTDGSGNIWSADSGFNTGLTASTANPISGTTNDVLYQTERYDKAVSPELEYRFTVPNGDYLVRLYFTELFSGAGGVGLRVFDVLIENQLVIDNLDIFSEVGLYAALIKSIPVTVADGQLNILFQHIMDENPKISAIEVFSTIPSTLPIADDFSDGTGWGARWTPQNDTSNPMDWSVVSGQLLQSEFLESDALDQSTSYHTGTYVVLDNPPVSPFPSDYRFSVDVTPLPNPADPSEGNDIGIMFRYQGPDDYYRVSMSAKFGFTRFEKRIGGSFETLAVNAIGYVDDQPMTLTAEVNGDTIIVWIDGDPVFAVKDPNPISSGTIALYCQDKAQFDNVLITETPLQPTVAISSPLAYSIALTPDDGTTLSVEAVVLNTPAGGSVAFSLDGVSKPASAISGNVYSASFTGVPNGNHTVTAVLRYADGTEADSDVNSTVGTGGDYYVTLGDSITNGVGDFDPSNNDSADGRIVSIQGFQAQLADDLTTATSRPQIVFNEGIEGDRAWELDDRLFSIMQRHPRANKVLVLIGTNDSAASPTSVTDFRNDVAAIATEIQDSGREVWVAEILPTNVDATRNTLIRQFNTEIRGIANASGADATFLGPDFYTVFTDRPDLYSGLLHPNDLGFQTMADEWQRLLP